jgi:ferric-dicitrate binding protein FerR (iron transport regulator)
MAKKTKHISDPVLLEYIKGVLPPARQPEIEQWLESDPGHREYLEQIRKIWMLSTSYHSFNQIDVQKDWQLVSNRLGGGRSIRVNVATKSVIHALARIAAIVLIVAGVGYLMSYLTGQPASLSRRLLVQTTSKPSTVDLPDGSRIYLNSGSSLQYPKKFITRYRKVVLTGEGWFEVAANRKQPFIVSADGAEIKVVGTSFNVHADQQNGCVIVNVMEGAVSFYPRKNEQQAILLTASEEGVFTADSLYEHPVTNQNFISWKTRILKFDNTPLEDVVRALEKHYQVPVCLTGDEAQDKTLTSVYDHQSLEEVLGELNLLLGITYQFANDTLVIRVD